MTKKETIEKLTKKDCEYLINNYLTFKNMLFYIFKEENFNSNLNKYLKLIFDKYNINYLNISKGKNSPISNISSKEFKNIVNKANSFSEILITLNIIPTGSHYLTLRNKFKEEGLDYQKFKKESNKSYLKVIRTNSELFIKDINIKRSVVRKRILKDKLIPYECKLCFKQPFSNGKPLSLTLDHINGVNYDHRLKNLRFLCPDCDRQQDTFGSKNLIMRNKKLEKDKMKINIPIKINKKYCQKCKKEVSVRNKGYLCKNCIILKNTNKECKDCDKKISNKNKSNTCLSCSKLYKKIYKDIKEVVIMVENQGYLQTGKHYNVTDNTIRKWLKKENINLIKFKKTWEENFIELFIYINKNEEKTNKIKNLIQDLRTKHKQNNLDKNKIDLLNLLSRDILHPEEKYQKEWISNINKIITWIDTNKIIPKRRIKNKEESSISEKIRTILRKDKNELWQEEKIIQLKDLMKQYQK